jgi:hypothetical protein
MNKLAKTESIKHAELLLISGLTLAVAIGLYFTNVTIW